MAGVTFDEVVDALARAHYELETEGRLVRAGAKKELESAPIVARWAWLYSPESLAATEGPGEERLRVRHALQQGLIERRTAEMNDRLETAFAKASLAVGDELIPFYSAQAQMSRASEASRREALGEAVGEFEATQAGGLTELTRLTLDVIRELGHPDYTGFWAEQKQIDYPALRREVAKVADAASDLYRAWVEPRMSRFGRRFGTCPGWHLSYIRGLPEHDQIFTVEAFLPAMRRTMERLGLPLFSAPTIHLDLADRPAKNPRASVWVPDAGREVHLLTRPSGGNADYSACLHEAGHALHFGLSDPGLGWPLVNLGRSMAYPELWSYLMERVGHDPAWISEATGVSAAAAERVSADLTGMDLMVFSRYVGKLEYELDLYASDPLDSARGPEIYRQRLSQRSGFAYDPRQWQFDRDPGLYSADYLRAWLAEAALEERLEATFGEHWWSHPESGDWLRNQWRLGWKPEAEEVVEQMGGVPGSGAALLRRFAARLAA